MSEIANYTFLPWLRQGIANRISGATGLRATVAVDLTLTGHRVGGGTDTLPAIRKDVAIYGPSDVVGIDRSAIIKVEPRDWITNFEPNYLPYIEFYDEDFPWRYTPTPSPGAGGHRLHPWITLVVLKTEEFDEGKNVKDRPLPYVRPKPGVQLPPSDQLWAWAHVHVNRNLIGVPIETDAAEDVAAKLASAVRANPDIAYSRIVCPRQLEANEAYHAFLVPVFEAGRLAGLGQSLAGAGALDFAWSEAVTPAELPYYHRWSFRTGTVGDFEYLVRLLKPQPADRRVGLRDIDVQEPGANLRGILDAPDATDAERLHGILKLGGTLRVPDILYPPDEFAVIEKYRKWATLNDTTPYPHPFQKSLAAFINLADAYETDSAAIANAGATDIQQERDASDPTTEYDIRNNPDPLITAPLYGRWHALTRRLLVERDETALDPDDNWVHQLNLDPRWRVAAGFGTRVVQEHQEDYMQAAWEQIGDVLESNKRIRQGQLAREAAWVWHDVHLKPLARSRPSKWLTLAAPVQARVVSEGVTISHRIAESRVPQAVLSPTMRKLLRPRGRLVKRLPFDDRVTPDNLVDRLNSGEVSAAPPREVPDIPTDTDIADDLKPPRMPGFLVRLLERHPWLRWIPLLLALLLLVLLLVLSPGPMGWAVGVLLIVALVALARWLVLGRRRIEAANSVLAENQTLEAVDRLPTSPDFRLSDPAEGFTPELRGDTDSEEGIRFKQALRDVHGMVQESIAQDSRPVRPSVDIAALATVLFERLDPRVTVPAWVRAGVIIPDRIRAEQDEHFVEAMAYPEIDLPMYKPLVELSDELFLPNINRLAENSISLLETNQEFIEAYMVGLNHEFARELLWREYPTDQRGSYFRQFWEAQGFHDTEGLTPEELRERLKDIPPIHRWRKRSRLGEHDHRDPAGDRDEVVLVIRGELLKRYPNAVIFAQRAVWRDRDGNPIVDPADTGSIDPARPRDLRPLTPAEQANPPREILKTPLYEAKVEPDIYFFGFDLSACQTRGGTGAADRPVDPRCAAEGVEWHDPGWFFVIQERPGEIAMGLDVPDEDDRLEDVKVWNDLSWNHVGVAAGSYLEITAATAAIPLQPLAGDEAHKSDQRNEDLNVSWGSDMSSADLAYVLYQVPVSVAVHGAELLTDQP